MMPSSFLRSPAFALAWEIWSRSRAGILTLGILLLSAGAINWTLLRHGPWSELATNLGFVLLVAALFATFGFFHFTEGRRKGGFGSFPQRLFNLPIATSWLVAVPMIYGSTAVLVVYLASVGFIFLPLGNSLPIVWPCLYLVASLAMFQTIVWSVPERRYLKILCLSLAATFICFGWMFFLPHVVEGTLNELGYRGNPRSFQTRLMIALFLTGPASYGISLWRIRQQRHGEGFRTKGFAAFCESASSRLFLRTQPFRSVRHAVFWHEWRQTGFILPISVAVILAMICVPAGLVGPLETRATTGVLLGLFVAPFFLAAIIGRGFAKPDFWNPSLKMAPFNAVRPLSAGQWVFSKLKVALASVVLTWAVVLGAAALWMVFRGDFRAFESELGTIRFYYAFHERWLLSVLLLIAAILLTWRFLIGGLPAGLSGRKHWYHLQNAALAIVLMVFFAYLISRNPDENRDRELFKLWPWIAWSPLILGTSVVAKATIAFFAWDKVHRGKLLEARLITFYFVGWIVATAALSALVMIACQHTAWLKACLLLISLLSVPLGGPALAILFLANNRSRP